MKTTEQLQEAYDVHKRDNLTHSVKPKIALCYSGQTRHINNDPAYTDDFYDILSLFNEFDCDLYGHTWTDQEDPNQEILKNFKEFKKTDQEDIWDAVKLINYGHLHFWNFLPGADLWNSKKEYKDIIDGNATFIDWAKLIIKGGLGQVWSAHESFKLFDVAYDWGNYAYVVRLRWDIKFIEESYEGHASTHIELLKDQFRQVLITNILNETASMRTARHQQGDVLTTDQVTGGKGDNTPYMNDHVFVIDGTSFRTSKIPHISPIILLQQIAHSNRQQRFPSSHSLWAEWLHESGFRLKSALPDITTGNGPSEGKINKEWDI